MVAKLLVSDNAEIKNTLTAGEIKVSGDITIKSGEIYIQNDTGSKVFNVDREGNLTATSATIKGTIEANDGVIGGFTIDNTAIYKNIDSMESDTEDGVYIGPDGISLGKQLKIYPSGVISSIPNLSTIDPNSPEAMLANNLVSRSNSKVIDIGVTLKGSYTVEDINTIGITQGFNVDDVVNIENDGSVTNEDGTTLDVKVGDNIIVVINEVSNVQYRFWNKISNAMYVETYAYQGKVKTSWLNHLLSLDPIPIEYGYIYQIDEVDEYMGILVFPGDYIVFIPFSGSSGKWSKFYYAESTSSTFFGITPDGILYANGAVISGDITVKSGEISIQNDNGSKVFKVDREGNLYADSATIKGDIIGGSMNINNNFIVNSNGSVTANNITATGGTIAGFTINNSGFMVGPILQPTLKIGSDGNLYTNFIRLNTVTESGLSTSIQFNSRGILGDNRESGVAGNKFYIPWSGIVHDPSVGTSNSLAIKAGHVSISGNEYTKITINNCQSVTAVLCSKATAALSYFDRTTGYYIEMDNTNHIANVYVGSSTAIQDNVDISYIILYEEYRQD